VLLLLLVRRRKRQQCWQVLTFLQPLPPLAAVLGLHLQQGLRQEAAPEAALGQRAWQGELGPLARLLAVMRRGRGRQQQQQEGLGGLWLTALLVVVVLQPCCQGAWGPCWLALGREWALA
jgi:hypothetical protein